MNFLRSTFADAKLKYRISHLVSDAVARKNTNSASGNSNTKKASSSRASNSESPPPGGSSSSGTSGGGGGSGVDATFVECVKIADVHAEQVLHAVRDHLSYSRPDAAYGALKLLEYLVACCNYNFHVVLARQSGLHEKLLQLAIRRTEDGPHRLVQREARLALLEWSRTFADDADLAPLARLAATYAQRTHKSLMRSINLLNKKIGFAEVQKKDYIMISPKENPGSMTQGCARPKPVSLHAAEVWSCPVCCYLNAPSATKCAGCDTVRLTTDEVPAKHAAILASANGQNATYSSSSAAARPPTPAPAPPVATVIAAAGGGGGGSRHADPTSGAGGGGATVLQGTAVAKEEAPQLHHEDARANASNDSLLAAVESDK